MVALLDSAAVVGFLDRDDAFHASADAAIRELAGRERLIVSVVTYAELLTGAGLGHHDEPAVQGFFADLIDEVADVDRTVAGAAARLRTAHRALRMPDALILATAQTREAQLLVTADQRWVGLLTDCRVELLQARA